MKNLDTNSIVELIEKVRDIAKIDRRQGGTVTSEFLAARLEGFANALELILADASP